IVLSARRPLIAFDEDIAGAHLIVNRRQVWLRRFAAPRNSPVRPGRFILRRGGKRTRGRRRNLRPRRRFRRHRGACSQQNEQRPRLHGMPSNSLNISLPAAALWPVGGIYSAETTSFTFN